MTHGKMDGRTDERTAAEAEEIAESFALIYFSGTGMNTYYVWVQNWKATHLPALEIRVEKKETLL